MAALGIASAIPAFEFLSELPIYLEFARGLAAGRLISSDLPMNWAVGYPLVLIPFVAIAGVAGVVALQAGATPSRSGSPWTCGADMAHRRSPSPARCGRGRRDRRRLRVVRTAPAQCRRAAAPAVRRARASPLGGRVPRQLRMVHVAGAWMATGDPLYFPGNGSYINLGAGNNEFARTALLTLRLSAYCVVGRARVAGVPPLRGAPGRRGGRPCSCAPHIAAAYSSPIVRLARLTATGVPTRRAINSRAALRGPVDELIS